MIDRAILPCVIFLLIVTSIGCTGTRKFRVVDTETGQRVADVSVQRQRSVHDAALRLRGQMFVETLGPTTDRGETIMTDVTPGDAVLFDREGYWPAVVYLAEPADYIRSHSYDTDAKDSSGQISREKVRSIKAGIAARLGVKEGGAKFKKDWDWLIVPLHPIGH